MSVLEWKTKDTKKYIASALKFHQIPFCILKDITACSTTELQNALGWKAP